MNNPVTPSFYRGLGIALVVSAIFWIIVIVGIHYGLGVFG